jgi:DNA-directed RNA polymerase specialized sigma24 family protein
VRNKLGPNHDFKPGTLDCFSASLSLSHVDALNVGQIIASMPDNLREILPLSYFKRFFYKQMVQILSIPIRAVKSKPHTAVGRFAKDLKESVMTKEVK